MRKRTTLRMRITLLVLLVVTLTIAVLAIASLQISSKSLIAQMTEDGNTIASSALIALKNRLNYDTSIEGLQALVDEYGDQENIAYICFIDENGIDIADSSHDDIGSSYWDDEATRNAIEQGVGISEMWTDDGETVLDVMLPVNVAYDGGTVRIVDVGIDLKNYVNARRLSLLMTFLVSFALLLLSVGVFGFASRKMITSPIREVAKRLQKMGSGDLRPETDPAANGLAFGAGSSCRY